jgi:hypothetical protein
MHYRQDGHPMRCDRCQQTHDRCRGHRRDGTPCRSWPVDGADKCRMHLGKRVGPVKARAKAERAVATYGLPTEVDPHDALLQEVHRTAGHVSWLGDVVADLERDDVRQWRHTGEEGGFWDVSVWVELYQRERTHLVRVAKAAIDAGIDERRVRLAEEQGQIIVQVLKATLAELGVEVTPDVAATVGRHLRAVS